MNHELMDDRNVTHYSYFGAFRSDVSNVGPNAAMLTEKGGLTDIGSWYMGGAATDNVPDSSGSPRAPAAMLGVWSCWAFAVAVGLWLM